MKYMAVVFLLAALVAVTVAAVASVAAGNAGTGAFSVSGYFDLPRSEALR